MYAQWLKKKADKIHPRVWDFIQLMRFDKPIGIYLLLWPTLSALWIAGRGAPSIKNIIIFSVGVCIMRAAGCIVNDFADRQVDGFVLRTQDRPLASKKVTIKQAFILFVFLLIISLLLVVCLNKQTIWLSIGAVLLACCYPFMKRYTYYPQVVLGAAYSWGILMAFTAQTPGGFWIAMVLYLSNVAWTVAYDTYYAMADREEDLKIGIKSTAIAFGRYDRAIILTLQLLHLIGWLIVGIALEFGICFYIGVFVALIIFMRQYQQTKSLDPVCYFKAFINNHWAGLVILLSVIISFLVKQIFH